MQQFFLDGIALCDLFENGYRNLKKNMNVINDLNVFPVPDGDTGTNMVKTFSGGLSQAGKETRKVNEYMQKLSNGVLLSARGNSGVIFSQFIHGLYRGFEGKEKIEFCDFAYALECATQDSYNAILSPAEGTILTVIREAAQFLKDSKGDYSDFKTGFEALLSNMKNTLAKTPDMLPVLKEAGVVDSGGAGLVCVIEGMYSSLCGNSIEDIPDLADSLSVGNITASSFGPDSVLEYGYCTEFILQLMNAKTDIPSFDIKKFLQPLEKMGDSIVAVSNDGIVKIHIHTFTPERVLEYAHGFGEFVTLKIENMSVQHSEANEESKPTEHLKYAIVSVASGQGIIDYFYNIGSNVVIDGGQTDNPPVDAFLDAFKSLDAEHIIVLPNNSNVILTAQQAASLYGDTDVRIIPTKSIVEGYSALSMMNLWCDTVEELVEDMSLGLSGVTTAYVTTATRDTEMNGIKVIKDNYIGLADKTILSCTQDVISAAKELIERIENVQEKEVIIVFRGASISDAQENEFKSFLEEKFPLAEIGFIDGKQGIYDFIISLE